MAKRKVLVVDDEQDVAKALKIRLKANGYNVVLAFDSVQAFTMANKEKPDLILLDIMIPGGGGVVVAERLKQSTATHHIPIIFLTGIPGGEERAYKLGASGYVM
jgi:CheY-like chemotaxis protein